MVSTRRQLFRSLQAHLKEDATPPSPRKRSRSTECTTPPLTTSRSATKIAAKSELQTPDKLKTPTKSKNSGSPVTTSPVGFLTNDQLAKIAPGNKYLDLKVPPEELRPSATLTTGQCFHWMACGTSESTASTSAWGTHDATEWVGVIRHNASSFVVAIRETPDTTLYRILSSNHDDGHDNHLNYFQILRSYFQLHHPLGPLYDEWSQQDSKRLAHIAKCIPGVRLIDQDPWECLVSFLCSSNNNIPRITKMLTAIRSTYGTPLLTIPETGTTLYTFPSLQELHARATDQDLRQACGMGYRAKYLIATMETLISLGGEEYLHQLRSIQDPIEVQERLCTFAGVGRKVADCVALFSLRQDQAIPVDTHVWNICRRDYCQDLIGSSSSLTPTVYQRVGNVFRTRFPQKAGWAHSLLFVAELPSFRPVLPHDVVEEMDAFRAEEQGRKQALKAEQTKKRKAAAVAAAARDDT